MYKVYMILKVITKKMLVNYEIEGSRAMIQSNWDQLKGKFISLCKNLNSLS